MSEAQQIAENFWFPNETDQQDKAFRKLEVRQVEELQRPYGWVFVYDTREWWETKDPETRDRFAPLSGACLILRKGGIAVYLGTYAPFERQLQEYEHFLYGVPT